ncbi:hypothetical protein HID58_034320 [Brassica napus]|uniref:(rape) hypothetical protein n=1 Tax=Brassica napus TaxID=3708 RepID=A0A816P416_BRANA|nr:hypothetical protein HID58_034320 [Brassica napus]CAF2044211.1 unnamed protein product [Brassica napus]
MALSFGTFIIGHRKADFGGTVLVSWPRKLIIDCACAEKMNRSCVFLAAQSLCLFATRVRSETGRYEDEKIRSLEEIRSWGRRNGRRS